MAYKIDKPEANSSIERLNQWANIVVDLLVFNLNDIDRRLDEVETPVKDTKNINAILYRLDRLEQLALAIQDDITTIQGDISALDNRVTTLEEGEENNG